MILAQLLACASPLPESAPCTPTTTCDEAGCWVALCGGVYDMGDPRGTGDADEQPVHSVLVQDLEVMVGEVTLGTWNRCTEAGACVETAALEDDPLCVRGDDEGLPLACIDWAQASAVCTFASARLPTEAEWEYFARSGGLDAEYPWGDEAPGCDRLVLDLETCGVDAAQQACSVPGGATDQGLCDVGGNVFEWCEDWYHDSYQGAPGDGSPWEVPGDFRVMRGGGIGSIEPPRTRNRVFHDPDFFYPGLGARCVR